MVFKVMILLAGLASWPCNAELRDPTQPAYLLPPTVANASAEVDLVLSAISISPRVRRATINGISAKQGQSIVIRQMPGLNPEPAHIPNLITITLISIDKNAVTIEQNGEIKTLHLVQRSYKIH